jgi:hypothetical protein
VAPLTVGVHRHSAVTVAFMHGMAVGFMKIIKSDFCEGISFEVG